MCRVELFDNTQIADDDVRLVIEELDECFVEIVANILLSLLNSREFVFVVVEILEEVGNVTQYRKGWRPLVNVAFLSIVVKMCVVHANDS